MSSLDIEIMKALKAEGYKVNEVIRDAVQELIEVVEEENEGMEIDEDDEVDEDKD